MPKIVDPVTRRRAVARAVLSVAARHGLERASLRNVAEEAGLAIGSVRHYFADHDELMIFTMRELSQRIGDRVRTHAERLLAPDGCTDRRAGTEQLLAEFLPSTTPAAKRPCCGSRSPPPRTPAPNCTPAPPRCTRTCTPW
ncbi:TetR/AcrR family transcriptional regulator [Streptomyces sirii]|uniref:TetR/AcrR family transcriptional regulator n=1 Tax=Streptomyces sirii TaxID=3127701 RepID=UPI003D35CBDC